MAGPLGGLNVVEMAGLGPTPLAGQLLADQGAEVILIDRRAGPADPADVNRRGKRSVVLDLKTAEGLRAARGLIDRADVLIEGFRPGVMERLGLGPEDCTGTNPGLVYGRMTGWGQSGPSAHMAGHDITYLAMTGALHAIGPEAGPVPPLNLVADYGGGTMFLLFGIMAALYERQRSGRGQVVDAAMVDGVPAMMGLLHGWRAMGDWHAARASNLLDGGAPFYRCYVCSDGRHVAVGALEPQFFAALVAGLGLDPQAEAAGQMDRVRWPVLGDRLAAIFATRPRDAWAAHFDGTDACVAPVLTMAEAETAAHLAQRGTLLRIAGVMQAAPAPRLSRSVAPVPAAPRAPGTDTDAILAMLEQGR